MKVTNKHDAPLNVAGTDIRPGATVDIDAGKYNKWALGNAAKLWIKAGIIVAGEPAAKAEPAPKEPEGGKEPTEREQLMAEAKELGLNPNATISNVNLKKMIAEAKGE